MTPEPDVRSRRRTGMNPRLLLAPLFLAVALPVGVATAPSASALSCVGPTDILEDATSIYTGRIVDGGGNRIEVEVEEIWRGERTPARVELKAGLVEWWAETTRMGGLPEGYAPEGTWLFVPIDGEVNPCTAWPLADYLLESAGEFRPANPQPPLPAVESPPVEAEPRSQAGTTSKSEQWAFVGGAGAGFAALAGGLSWWGLRRSRR